MNSVNLIGHIVKDPELKNLESGKSVCTFSMAVDRPYAKDQVDFLNCVAWNKTGEFISNYFKKGQQIGITGSIQTRSYEDKNGNKRTAFEIIANQAYFCGSKGEGKSEQTEIDDFKPVDDDADDLPF